MQGRLSPPNNGSIQSFPCSTWHKEFLLAKQAGLDCIEWIYDTYGDYSNPFVISTSDLVAYSTNTGIEVKSMCVDYFLDRQVIIREIPIEFMRKVEWIVSRCQLSGI